MSVPDHRHVPKKLFDTGLFDLKTEDGHGAFTDACVAALHALDARWGHLKKTGSQSHIHHHGEDSALYLSDTPGQSQAVDFIGGAGGPNPQPGWIVDAPRYSEGDWRDPFDHGFESAPTQPPPSTVPPPPRDEALDELNYLDYYYASPQGLQRPNGLAINGKPDFEGVAAWYLDVYQRERMSGKSRAEARAAYVSDIRHSSEWQAKHPGENP